MNGENEFTFDAPCSVNAGDKIAVIVEVLIFGGSDSFNIRGPSAANARGAYPAMATDLSGFGWVFVDFQQPNIALSYSGTYFHNSMFITNAASAPLTKDRMGNRFKLPFKCSIIGLQNASFFALSRYRYELFPDASDPADTPLATTEWLSSTGSFRILEHMFFNASVILV